MLSECSVIYFFSSCYVPLPKLTSEGYRVTITNLSTNNVDEYEPYDLAACLGHYVEIRLMKDIMVGEIYIADLQYYTLSHIAKVTPMVLKKIFTAGEVTDFFMFII